MKSLRAWMIVACLLGGCGGSEPTLTTSQPLEDDRTLAHLTDEEAQEFCALTVDDLEWQTGVAPQEIQCRMVAVHQADAASCEATLRECLASAPSPHELCRDAHAVPECDPSRRAGELVACGIATTLRVDWDSFDCSLAGRPEAIDEALADYRPSPECGWVNARECSFFAPRESGEE